MMQVRMLAGEQEGSTMEPSAETFEEVARLLLMVNDLLEGDYEEAKGASTTSQGVDHALAASMFRNHFYSHRANWGPAMGRHWGLLTFGGRAVHGKFPKEVFDVQREHQALLGFAPTDMLTIMFALVAYYSSFTPEQLNERPDRFLVGVDLLNALGGPEMRAQTQAIFAACSADWDAHVAAMRAIAVGPRKNVQQFFSVYNTPLMREAEVYFPLDFEFLRSQTTEGWFWSLVRVLRQNNRGPDIGRLNASFGRAFEWFCSELTRPLRDGDVRVWSDWDGEIQAQQGQQVPDILLVDGSVLFVIEVTSSAVPPSAAVSCDPAVLEGAISRAWFGPSRKLEQLQNAHEGVLAERVTAGGLNLANVKRVVPLLVTLRYLPRHLGLWHWYRDIMRKNALRPEFIEAVRILDSEDWEELCFGAIEGHGVAAQFDAWQGSDWAWQSFEDWRAATLGNRPLHPLLRKFLDDLFERMPPQFDPKRAGASV